MLYSVRLRFAKNNIQLTNCVDFALLDPCAEYDGIGTLAEPELTVCCAKTCGSCGGGGCTGRPGGTQNCCTGNIKNSGKICGVDGNKAPCTIPGT